jgi:hypothetical protein
MLPTQRAGAAPGAALIGEPVVEVGNRTSTAFGHSNETGWPRGTGFQIGFNTAFRSVSESDPVLVGRTQQPVQQQHKSTDTRTVERFESARSDQISGAPSPDGA